MNEQKAGDRRTVDGAARTVESRPIQSHRLSPAIWWLLFAGIFMAFQAQARELVASIGESSFSAEYGRTGNHDKLVNLVHALDKATNSSTQIIVSPFARSLKMTAAGYADFHFPLIQNDGEPAPPGLAFVTEVEFGKVDFVIYSRKSAPLDAGNVAGAARIEAEPGHRSFFPFRVGETTCLPCSLEKILLGRADALIVSGDIVDPLLSQPKYKGIHRALYKTYPVRALVPANADSTETRRYLIEGAKRLEESGEFWKLTGHDKPYSNWQP